MHRKLARVLELVRIGEALSRRDRGRPLAERAALARALVAKAL